MNKRFIKASTAIAGGLLVAVFLSTLFLISPSAKAANEDSGSSDMGFNVVVPTSCSLSANNVSLSETINPGQSKLIGTAKINAVCNDPSGLAVYAVGYTDDTYGKDVLVTELSTPEHNYDIATGTNTTGDSSSWSMKVVNTDLQGNYTANIHDNFNEFHIIPDAYAKVASRTAHTDTVTGTNLDISFNAYISTTQPASTYRGKVKFTLVHPSAHVAPETPIAVPGQICYYGNGADEGSMACQTTTVDISNSTIALSANAEVQLRASNFSRAGYGFTGWNTKEDGTGTQYGPMETITFTQEMYDNGLMLFANWKAPETDVTMQTFDDTVAPYSTAPNGTVIALKDIRDNDVYAVAKLADGKWWMIENLRLDYDANITTSNTQSNNGAWGDVFAGLPEPESANFFDSTTANSLYTTDTSSTDLRIITGSRQSYRFPRYNNDNTTNRQTNATGTGSTYSYGNYYTWAAAIADTTAYSTENQSVTSTSLCPTGWHLPKGGDKSNEANNEWWSLTTTIIGANPANYDSQTHPYYTNNSNTEGTDASKAMRRYPTNLVYSGSFSVSSANSRGWGGYYWSSTIRYGYSSYIEYIYSSLVYPGTFSTNRYGGFAVRCLADTSSIPTNNEPDDPNSGSEPSSPTNNPSNPTNSPSNSPSYSPQSYNPQTTNRSSSNQTDELDKNVNKKDDTKSTSAKSTSTEPLGVKNSREDTENIARVGGNGAEVYGTIAIAGAAALGAAGLFFLAGKRRKDDEEEEK